MKLSRRWLRLLFGREFQLFDLLILWDAIFAEASEFELTNYIVVAMLISIREESESISGMHVQVHLYSAHFYV